MHKYRYQLISEIECLDNIGISDIPKGQISNIPNAEGAVNPGAACMLQGERSSSNTQKIKQDLAKPGKRNQGSAAARVLRCPQLNCSLLDELLLCIHQEFFFFFFYLDNANAPIVLGQCPPPARRCARRCNKCFRFKPPSESHDM